MRRLDTWLEAYRVEVDRLLQEAEARWFIAQP